MSTTRITIDITPDEFRAITKLRQASSITLALLGADLGVLQGLVDKVFHAVRAKLPEGKREGL